jgi:hypothetical protein
MFKDKEGCRSFFVKRNQIMAGAKEQEFEKNS